MSLPPPSGSAGRKKRPHAKHAAQQQRWHYRLERGRVWFDNEIRRAHQRFKQSIPAFIAAGSVFNLLTAPVIYSLIVPLLLLDLLVTLYQWICFPIYGIAVVRRQPYSWWTGTSWCT